MGGFASLLGGMAEPAQRYGAQQRELGLQTWSIQHKAALDSIDQEIARNEVPERLADLYNFRKKVATTRPGDDISKLWQDYQAHTNLHPATADALTPKPPPKSPGPAQPGQVPGTPQISPVAAQPTGSPVQPDTQGPNLLSGLLSQPAPTPQVGPTIQAAQAGVQPVQGSPADSSQTPGHGMTPMLAGSYGAQLLERISNFRKAGFSPPPQLVAEAQPYLTNEAELARTRGMLDTQLSYKKQGIEAMHKSGTWDKLQPIQQAGYEGEGYGLSPINLPATAMIPRLMGNDVPGLSAPQDQVDAFGNPVVRDSGHLYRIEQDQLTGVPKWYPRAVQTVQTQNPGGVQINNRQTGVKIADVEGAIPGVMNTPKVGTTGTGGEVLYTPAGLKSGQAPSSIPGVVNPAMMGSQRSTSTQQLPTGETVTSTATRRTPFAATAQSKPAAGTPATHSASGQVNGNDYFKSQVSSAVASLMQPNLSSSQYSTLFKKLVGPERSPMAEAVRQEIRNRTAQDATAPLTWDVSTAERAQLATQSLGHIKDIESLIHSLDQKGELGPVMSRWSEFWTGTLGKDLSANQDFVRLKNNVDLLTKLMGRVHGGARGGGSIQMIQSFANKLNVDKMDAPTLLGAISAEKNWLSTYANPSSGVGGALPPVNGSSGSVVDRLLEKYRGK